MFFVSVLTKDGSYKHLPVPKEVYEYIIQLELCIKYPEESNLKEVYKERFRDTNE